MRTSRLQFTWESRFVPERTQKHRIVGFFGPLRAKHEDALDIAGSAWASYERHRFGQDPSHRVLYRLSDRKRATFRSHYLRVAQIGQQRLWDLGEVSPGIFRVD